MFYQPQIKKLKEEDDHYESARFDVSLYNTANPKDLMCHIEFKHENADEKEIGKDLLKLTNEFGKGYSTRNLKLMRKFYIFQN